jgi:hypothetical protein
MTKPQVDQALRYLLIVGAAVAASCVAVRHDDPPPADKWVLPTIFRHDRIFVAPRTQDGQTVEFFTDSGGGWNAIRQSEAARLGLAANGIFEEDDGRKSALVDFPSFAPGHGIPPPSRHFEQGRLVAAEDKALQPDTKGFLGGRWFADRVWEFDYAAKSLSVLRGWRPPVGEAHGTALGFKANATGFRPMHYPRVTMRVDREPVDVLLDTGATVQLTADSGKALGLPEGSRVGASYITKSIFERWSARHPEWKVVSNGDRVTGNTFPMIEVPLVAIAGQAVGPVWFTQRPDRTFRQGMSPMMDAPIDGAIGGSTLRYFRMIVDYPGARAYFYARTDGGASP